jgi:phosphoglycerol transferase MdoB-like AlkP superfamily enzyme
MVQVESLQEFVVGLEVMGQQVTPFLNRWAEDSLRFVNVTDQTAQGRSSDSELATQVSLLPPPTGAAAFLYPGNRFTGLASVLRERGYDTLSAVAFEGSFWNRRTTHASFGYSSSLFDDAFAPGERVGWGLNDRDFFAQAVDRLAQLERPFCAYLLTLSLHHPFEGFPDHLHELELGGLEGSPLGNYLHTMRFFDRAFAGLISSLERRALSDSTVVVVWGDHDAGLEWTPELAALTGHPHDPAGWYLSQRIPLLIRLPDPVHQGRVFDLPAGHQDVAPTVAALIGVDPRSLAWMGRNLLGRPGDAPVVGEYQCWRTRDRLFLQGDGTLDGGSCRSLPDLGELPAAACAPGFEDARRQIEVSRMVLEHDLQQEITNRLSNERQKIADW